MNSTQIVTPKPARKNTSTEAVTLAKKGFTGSQINLAMAAATFNFKKWIREVVFWLRKLKQIETALETSFLRYNIMVV